MGRLVVLAVVVALAAGCSGSKRAASTTKGNEYPAASQGLFLRSCESQAATTSGKKASIFVSYCTCTLHRLEAAMSFAEFARLDRALSRRRPVNGVSRRKFAAAIRGCAPRR